MKVVTYIAAADFQARAWPLLLEREAENNLILGIAGRLAAEAAPPAQGAASAGQAPGGTAATTGAGGAKRPMFWTVEDGARLPAAAMVTPPHRLVLTRGASQAVDALCDHLHRSGINLPGVMGPKEAAERFGARWRELCGCGLRQSHGLCVYQIDRVQPVAGAPGRMEAAQPGELDLLLRWSDAFAAEVRQPYPPDREAVSRSIDAGLRFVWRHPHPVAVATAAGPTPSGIRISSVYTPPEYRRRGYATALVAALSQRQLDAGRRFCFLFTDLANPTSNSIYQKIGYRAAGEFQEIDFGAVLASH